VNTNMGKAGGAWSSSLPSV